MQKIPAITEAEWPLMKILWDQAEGGVSWLGAAEIVDPVATDRGIHHRTARTLLARLVKKRAVETKPANAMGGGVNGAYLYRAKVSRDAVTREAARSFLSRIFDGNAAPALVHLLKESRGQLSAQELKDLRALLSTKERG